jgi:hypothetical protein
VSDDAPKDDAGFVPIFDGQSLAGWTGAVEGYYVEDGCLVSRHEAGGILYSEAVYSDFILRFDFKLEAGGNNGIGIRVPLGGHPSQDGMEIQILDNGDPQYADLGAYQYHGSVYGITPAKRGYLREVGQWNHQEIRCIGRRIVVILNGETIVDTNLDEALANGAIDGKEHPGAALAEGHLALCGHSTRVAFRDMQIKVVED